MPPSAGPNAHPRFTARRFSAKAVTRRSGGTSSAISAEAAGR